MNDNLVEIRRIKKVAILGAGASADAGAPTIDNFWDKLQSLINKGNFDSKEIDKVNEVKQKREQLLPNSDIEEFYSYLDFQIDFDVLVSTKSFSRSITYKTHNIDNKNCIPITPDIKIVGKELNMFKQLKEDTSWLISKTLSITLEKIDEEVSECYKKIIKDFDVVLSFNWDNLYENTYEALNGKQIPLNQLGFSKTILCKPALLKLHGSATWGVCTTCNSMCVFPKIVGHLIDESLDCPKCSEENQIIDNGLVATSIMPTLNKFKILSEKDKNGAPPFRNIWHCAMHALTEAEEIYCFGYSLSDKDVHSQIFFKCAIQNNLNKRVKVYVIDKKCDRKLRERYKDIFGIKTIFVNKTFKGYFQPQKWSLSRFCKIFKY